MSSHCTRHQDRKLRKQQLEGQSEGEKLDRAVNEEADRVCELAGAQHPPLHADTYKKDKWASQVATKVIRYAAVALSMFTQNERHQRLKPQERRRTTRLRIEHQWIQIAVDKAMRWRCSTC